MSSLFRKIENANAAVPLTSLNKAVYAIDVSGSTSGYILKQQVASAKMLCDEMRKNGPQMQFTYITWNSTAQVVKSLSTMTNSSGGTRPETVVPHLVALQPDLFIIYTDGECNAANFRSAMTQANIRLPIIVVFTLGSSWANEKNTRISNLYSQVDMSVPEGVLASSNSVCIVVNSAQSHKVLMASGAFTTVYEIDPISNDTLLSSLPDFDMTRLSRVMLTKESQMSPGCIMLDQNLFADPLDLEALYNAPSDCAELDAKLIGALSARPLLARYDLNRLHAVLVRQLESDAPVANPEYDAAMERLMIAAADKNKSAEHFEARAQVERIRKEMRGAGNDEKKAKRAAIHNLLNIIADYRANSNQFVLGSNRANRAALIGNEALGKLSEQLHTEDPAKAAQISECPIFLQNGAACILLADISANSNDDGEPVLSKEQRCTGDLAIDAPFNLGARYLARITPGVFCSDFGLTCHKNPTTREPIVAQIVLVHDTRLLMQQLCAKFCAGREMWHMVTAFASLLAAHVIKDEWADRAILVPYIQWLCSACTSTPDFKEAVAGVSRVSLSEAMCNAVSNYATVCRNRFPSDVRAMLDLLHVAEPTRLEKLEANKIKLLGMVNVIETFARLLKIYKSGNSMISYIMHLDPTFGHCMELRAGLDAIIAYIFFLDGKQFDPADPSTRRGPKRFCNLALQEAIDLALRLGKDDWADPAYEELVNAFQGVNVDNFVPVRLPVVPVNNVHFGDIQFPALTSSGDHQCAYCGLQWPDTVQGRQAKMDHLYYDAFGSEHIYNGIRCLQLAIDEIGLNADTQRLFKLTKQKLLHKHSVTHWVLHTDRCTKTLSKFIENRKKGLPEHGRSAT